MGIPDARRYATCVNRSTINGLDKRLDALASRYDRNVKMEEAKERRNTTTFGDMMKGDNFGKFVDHDAEAGLVPGDRQLEKLREAIESFPTRSQQQVTFMELFLQASLRLIYGDDYDRNEIRIKADNMMDELFQFALVACPRRFGKSAGTAMYVSSWVVTQPGTTVLIYSPGKRQSKDLMKYMRNMIAGFRDKKGYPIRVSIDNEEEFEVMFKDGRKSIIKALPAKEQTTRGQTGDIIILEEAAMMEPGFVLSSVLPVAMLRDSAFLSISTLKGETNWMSKLPDIRIKGKRLFNSFFFLNACEECIKEGEALSCPHKKHERPAWISDEKTDKLAAIYAALGQTDLMKQEQMNMMIGSKDNTFSPDKIDKLFTREGVTIDQLNEKRPSIVYVSCDPDMGGKRSNFSLCSMLYDRGCPVILGVEDFHSTTENDKLVVTVAHMKAIRAMPGFEGCAIVFIPEGNWRDPTQNIVNYVNEHLDGVYSMRKDGFDVSGVVVGQAPGARTAGTLKENMCATLNAMLEEESICLFDPFITTFRASKTTSLDQRRLELQRIMRTQLTDYQVVEKQSKDPTTGFKRISHSGKAGGKKDDMCMALQIVLYWSAAYRSDPSRAGFFANIVKKDVIYNNETGGTKRKVVPVDVYGMTYHEGDQKRQR